MKKISLIIIGSVWLLMQGFSQQIPLFTQNSQYNALLNPAALNMDAIVFQSEAINHLGVSFRTQWVGIEDSPLTGMIRYNRHFPNQNMLAGIALIIDETAPTNNSGGILRYAYQMPMATGTLSLGLAAGFFQNSYRGDEVNMRDANDFIAMETRRRWYADFSLGAFYYTELYNSDLLFAGVSIPQLAGIEVAADGQSADYYDYRKQHYQARIGYLKFLGNSLMASEQNFLETSLRANFAKNTPLKITSLIKYQMQGTFWIGGGYAGSFGSPGFNSDDLRFEAGVILFGAGNTEQVFKIGYAFEFNLSAYQMQLGNTHEVNLAYMF